MKSRSVRLLPNPPLQPIKPQHPVVTSASSLRSQLNARMLGRTEDRMKYKNIKSVAHNIGYSFLSDMNAVQANGRYTIVPELLFRAAERECVREVRIDLLTGEIQPESVALPEVREAVSYHVRWLAELLSSQNVSPSAVTGAVLGIQFDFSRRRHARNQPEMVIQEFACGVEIIDDRGRIHRGRPNNWWYE